MRIDRWFMALFRPHRKLLEDSLKDTVIVKNIDEIKDTLRREWKGHQGFDFDKIKIRDYAFDKRCGWYTQIITIYNILDNIYYPTGFLSEPLI